MKLPHPLGVTQQPGYNRFNNLPGGVPPGSGNPGASTQGGGKDSGIGGQSASAVAPGVFAGPSLSPTGGVPSVFNTVAPGVRTSGGGGQAAGVTTGRPQGSSGQATDFPTGSQWTLDIGTPPQPGTRPAGSTFVTDVGWVITNPDEGFFYLQNDDGEWSRHELEDDGTYQGKNILGQTVTEPGDETEPGTLDDPDPGTPPPGGTDPPPKELELIDPGKNIPPPLTDGVEGFGIRDVGTGTSIQDLFTKFLKGDWKDAESLKEIGAGLTMKSAREMFRIMNRISDEGIYGPAGRKFIRSGEKRESQLRRQGLRKNLQRRVGRDLGGRGGGAIENMLFNQIDAPDFARQEGDARDLRKEDLKSRLAGVEGNAQLLNMFNAWAKGQQTQSQGGPGALQTISDVAKIGASIAAAFSDMRLKEDIKPAEPGIDEIMQLEPSTFTWKDSGEKDLGLIAQDVEKVLPDAVVTMPGTDYLGLKPMSLIATLVNAVKELKAEIDELKAERVV